MGKPSVQIAGKGTILEKIEKMVEKGKCACYNNIRTLNPAKAGEIQEVKHEEIQQNSQRGAVPGDGSVHGCVHGFR